MEKIRCPIDNHSCSRKKCIQNSQHTECNIAVQRLGMLGRLGELAMNLIEADETLRAETQKNIEDITKTVADKFKIDKEVFRERVEKEIKKSLISQFLNSEI